MGNKQHKFIYLDTETTGINTEECGLIQIGGIIEIDDVVKEKFSIRSNIWSTDQVAQEALEKNGISLDRIYSFQHPNIALKEFKNHLGTYVDPYDKMDKFVVVGYVADFDNRVLRSWFRKAGDGYYGSWFWNPWIDVMVMAMFALQRERNKLENFKQGTVAQYLGIDTSEKKLHDALYDANITREIYWKIATGDLP